MTLEKRSSPNKVVYFMDDFNIDLFKSEISDLSQNFLLSLQSYSFFPVIDKPTRVYNNSATLTFWFMLMTFTDAPRSLIFTYLLMILTCFIIQLHLVEYK